MSNVAISYFISDLLQNWTPVAYIGLQISAKMRQLPTLLSLYRSLCNIIEPVSCIILKINPYDSRFSAVCYPTS